MRLMFVQLAMIQVKECYLLKVHDIVNYRSRNAIPVFIKSYLLNCFEMLTVYGVQKMCRRLLGCIELWYHIRFRH